MEREGRQGRRSPFVWFWLVAALALWPMGCSPNVARSTPPPGTPSIRVLVLESQQQVSLSATTPPTVHVGSAATTHRLNFPPNAPVPVSLTPAGWRVGTAVLGAGEMILEPAVDGSVRLGKNAYHGRYRFVPVAPDKFDVVNELDLESYLKGVLPSELYPTWHEEAFKAQAIVARTYALYESRTAGPGRHFDVFGDVRSQAYGGMNVETPRSREATDATAGIVVAYGPPGHETIFKAYFSSCCGGISQSAYDAFGDPNIQPLVDQNRGAACAESTRFSWGPIFIPKAEITRRIRAWGAWKKAPEKDIGPVARIDIHQVSRFGRPIAFYVTDTRGMRHSLAAEQLREAVNTDAGTGVKIPSSFCKPIDDGPNIRFADGHGYGHGVGMCQWCAQHQATHGWNDEAIVLTAFPGAKLVRAY